MDDFFVTLALRTRQKILCSACYNVAWRLSDPSAMSPTTTTTTTLTTTEKKRKRDEPAPPLLTPKRHHLATKVVSALWDENSGHNCAVIVSLVEDKEGSDTFPPQWQTWCRCLP